MNKSLNLKTQKGRVVKVLKMLENNSQGLCTDFSNDLFTENGTYLKSVHKS